MSDSRAGIIVFPATSLKPPLYRSTALAANSALLFPKPRDRIRDALDRDDLEPVDLLLRLVGLGDDRAGEAELGGFLQALLAARRGTHFAREPDLAEHGELFRQRLVGERGNDREQDGQVRR